MDGRIEIDNNPAENAIRPNVLGTKIGFFPSVKLGQKQTQSV
ncbi:IS66 family transposase [Virgibacillus pantothenticus]|nr:transposase [Virgibacillus pantothenticus]